MTFDDWVDRLQTAVGHAEFKQIGMEFLREFYGCTVLANDGKGDGKVDAWVVMQSEPLLRVGAQFHAGKAEAWDAKLTRDVKARSALRNALAEDDPRRREFTQLIFVCTQGASEAKTLTLQQSLQDDYNIAIRVFDAKAVVSKALERRGPLYHLLVQNVPGYEADERALPDARDEFLIAFSLFHEGPRRFRWAVAKSGISTVLHQGRGELLRDELLQRTAELLRLTHPSKLLDRTLRNLLSEAKVSLDGDLVRAEASLTNLTQAALKEARMDEEALRSCCVAAIEPLLPKGTHHRASVAREGVDAVFADMGLFVRDSVVGRAVQAIDPRRRARVSVEADARRQWQTVEHRLAQVLGLDRALLGTVLKALVDALASSPFAHRLAAAELFLRITEHDASEVAQAIEASSQRVMVDTSIAMPMLCALFDRPAVGWPTSVAAHALYALLKARGARCVVPTVYVEEIAAHLQKARVFAQAVAFGAELERSGNCFVAHFCSTRTDQEARSPQEFLRFLGAFGLSPMGSGTGPDERRRIEAKVSGILSRYGIEVADVSCREDDPRRAEEPSRDDLLLKHDRAVIRALEAWSSRTGPRWLACTADLWLQGVLNDLGVTALDAAGLADLMDLLAPADTARTLHSPLALALALSNDARVLEATVWDELFALEGDRLVDWELLERARAFKTKWLAERRDPSKLKSEWINFRDG